MLPRSRSAHQWACELAAKANEKSVARSDHPASEGGRGQGDRDQERIQPRQAGHEAQPEGARGVGEADRQDQRRIDRAGNEALQRDAGPDEGRACEERVRQRRR